MATGSGMGTEPKLDSLESVLEFLLELLRELSLPTGISERNRMSGGVADSHLITIEEEQGLDPGPVPMCDCSGLTMGNYKGVMSAWVVITQYHRLGGSNNIHLFLMLLQAWKLKIKVLVDSVFGEGLLPGVQMATISLCAHMTSL